MQVKYAFFFFCVYATRKHSWNWFQLDGIQVGNCMLLFLLSIAGASLSNDFLTWQS